MDLFDELENPPRTRKSKVELCGDSAEKFIKEYDSKNDPQAEHTRERIFAGDVVFLAGLIAKLHKIYERALQIVSDDLFLERAKKVFPDITLNEAKEMMKDRSEFASGIHLLYPTPWLDITREQLYEKEKKSSGT